MAQQITFDYFRGMEAEQYTFYRIPKILFTAECFKSLSCEAKVLYGLMLDRMSLSIKNRWVDEQDRVYIVFTVEEVMELLGCGRQKAIKNISELDTEKGIGLIEKKRFGLGKPNVIYVKNFMMKECTQTETEKEVGENAANTQKYENQTSGSMKISLQEVPKSNSNNTDYNNTEFSNTDPINLINLVRRPCDGKDTMDEIDEIRREIHDRIEYDILEHDNPLQVKMLDELVELIVEILIQPDTGQIRVGGAMIPMALAKERFRRLEYEHIQYVMYCLQKNSSHIGNIKAYLLTALYNAPITQHNYFQAAVNADQASWWREERNEK